MNRLDDEVKKTNHNELVETTVSEVCMRTLHDLQV